MRIMNAKESDWRDQRNNARIPFGACNVTSGIMFLLANGIPYTNPTTDQDEDYLMWVLRQPEAYLAMETLCDWKVNKKAPAVTDWNDKEQVAARYISPPEQQWGTLAWGINRIAGKTVCAANYNPGLRILEFYFEIVKGRSMVAGGLFTKSGHFVCVCGLKTEQEDILGARTPIEIAEPLVTHVIVDDPYGNFLTGYADHRGNGVEIPVDKFLDAVACFRNPAYGRQYRIYAIVKKAA